MFDRDNPKGTTTHEIKTYESIGINDKPYQHMNVKYIPTDMLTKHKEQPGASIRGQIDTGATVSCSNAKHLFHNYREYNAKFKSPVRLCAAIDRKHNDRNSSIVPEGEGYLLIPAMNIDGYIPVRAFYSPHLTSTLIGDNCIMGTSKKDHQQFATQSLVKYLSHSTFSIICHHKLKKSKDIQIDGVLIDNKCFTHPLVILDLDKQHPLANPDNSMDIAWEASTILAVDTQRKAQEVANHYVQKTTEEFNQKCKNMPEIFRRPTQIIFDNQTIPINSMYIKKRTEKLLWHQKDLDTHAMNICTMRPLLLTGYPNSRQLHLYSTHAQHVSEPNKRRQGNSLALYPIHRHQVIKTITLRKEPCIRIKDYPSISPFQV